MAVAAPTDEDALKPLIDKGLMTQFADHLSTAKDKASGQATGLITQAMDLLGVPYRRGGSTEAAGFDCSGFVRHLYESSVGMLLPRRAEEQARSTETIDRSELKPGDLVFFNTMKRAFSHVGIYVGDGKFIHSPRSGKAVKVDDMRSAYWQKRFNGARRVPLDTEPTKP
ncbi:MAG: C40 family peptidase [Limnohabitans sp.]